MKTARRSFFLFLFILVIAIAPCRASTSGEGPGDYAGEWAMKLGQRNFMVLDLAVAKGKVSGTLHRPLHYMLLETNFAEITPASTVEIIVEATVSQGKLNFLARNPSSKNEERFEMVVRSAMQAELRKFGADRSFGPWTFSKVPPGRHAAVAGNWEPHHLYFLDELETSDPEMKKIYEADQQDRSADFDKMDQEARGAVNVRDVERRAATRKLLAEGRLHTGEDYREAAFVFQHGNKPEDYLLAHTLATVATSRGDMLGLWISAATLDRYLHSIEKPQIFGTQFLEEGNTVTQAPFDRELIPDALRRQLGVPALAEQQSKETH
jgi:hypothetical protein